MAAAVREKFFTVVLESVNHGTALRSQFERINVTSIGALLAAYPSFTREVPDAIEVEGLAKQLQKITDPKKDKVDKVAFVASPAGLAILRTMLATARSLQGPEAAAVGATAPWRPRPSLLRPRSLGPAGPERLGVVSRPRRRKRSSSSKRRIISKPPVNQSAAECHPVAYQTVILKVSLLSI